MPDALSLASQPAPERPAAGRDDLLPGLVRHARSVTPLPRGVRFTFNATAERLRQLHEVATRESGCSAALDLRPGFTPGGAFLQLDVTAPDEARDVLDRLMALAVAA